MGGRSRRSEFMGIISGSRAHVSIPRFHAQLYPHSARSSNTALSSSSTAGRTNTSRRRSTGNSSNTRQSWSSLGQSRISFSISKTCQPKAECHSTCNVSISSRSSLSFIIAPFHQIYSRCSNILRRGEYLIIFSFEYLNSICTIWRQKSKGGRCDCECSVTHLQDHGFQSLVTHQMTTNWEFDATLSHSLTSTKVFAVYSLNCTTSEQRTVKLPLQETHSPHTTTTRHHSHDTRNTAQPTSRHAATARAQSATRQAGAHGRMTEQDHRNTTPAISGRGVVL